MVFRDQGNLSEEGLLYMMAVQDITWLEKEI